MKKWLHWQFVVPRVLALIVAMLAAQYVLGVVARSIVIQAGEAALSVPVEVGHARVFLADQRVVFDGLRMVNGRRSSENILEADRCELKFAAAAAWHKQAVIESGRISGLRFNGIADAAGRRPGGAEVA
jgi:hypothetical protein